MKVADVAKILGTSAMTIRVGLQQGIFPFGVAFKTNPENKSYYYLIYPKKLREFADFMEVGDEETEEIQEDGVVLADN